MRDDECIATSTPRASLILYSEFALSFVILVIWEGSQPLPFARLILGRKVINKYIINGALFQSEKQVSGDQFSLINLPGNKETSFRRPVFLGKPIEETKKQVS